MKKILIMMLVLMTALSAGCIAGGKDNGGKKVANRIAVFETNKGTFEIELFEDKTPITTKNFIDLTEKGFYNGVIFHRVIDGFMIQGGDPDGTGMGGPGYTIEDEFLDDLRFDGEGILAMANTGMPHTGGSQFFITLDKTPWLNGKHTIFGKVIKGMDVVRTIGHSDTDFADRPLEKVVMEKVTIKDAESGSGRTMPAGAGNTPAPACLCVLSILKPLPISGRPRAVSGISSSLPINKNGC